MSQAITLGAIADFLGGACIGDPALEIRGIAPIDTAQPHEITFAASKQYEFQLADSRAGAVIINQSSSAPRPAHGVVVANAYLAYAQLSKLFETRPVPAARVHPSAVIHPSAQLAAGVSIGPHCVIEADVIIGEDVQLLAGAFIGCRSTLGASVVIFPNVVIYHDVHIGARSRIHANSTIGSDGFGYAPTPHGWQKIHQLGGVRIGSDVEIGANTAIDRGALEPTELADGVIIDNQVHIAHNVKIGKNTAIAGCVGIAGSTQVGANCTMGGFVAINGHLEIADNVHFNGGSIVTKSIAESGHYSSGTLLQDVKTWRRNAVRFGQLDEWIGRLKRIENSLQQDQ